MNLVISRFLTVSRLCFKLAFVGFYQDLTRITVSTSSSLKLNNAEVGITYLEVDLGVLKWVDVFLSGSWQSMNMS